MGKEGLVSSREFQEELNLLSIGLLAMGFGGYLVLNPPLRHQFFSTSSGWIDLFWGFISWIIAFPLMLCISQLLIYVLVDLLDYSLVEQLAVRQIRYTSSEPILFFITLFAVVVVIPCLEEVLFRGFLQGAVRGYLSAGATIVITSFIFTLFHFAWSQGVNNINILSSLFVLSLFLGLLKEKRGNIIAPLALHSIFNGISVSMLFWGMES